MKIVITTSSFGKYDKKPLDELEKARIQYELNPFGRKLTQEEVLEFAAGCEGIIAGTESLDAHVLTHLDGLKVISRCGVGMDNVDLDAAKELDITVYNTPDGPTQSVAELTVCLILDLLRRVSLMDRNMRKGTWEKYMGNLLSGKNVAIVGFGRIGQKVAQLLAPFLVKVAYCDICSIECSYPEKQKKDLLQWADIVTLHCSANSNEKPVIGKRELGVMKSGSYLINISRGGLVDEKALHHALSNGYLAGAALDVFEVEPYSGPLSKLPNVILTPHIGSYAAEGRVAMEFQAVRNLVQGLSTF